MHYPELVQASKLILNKCNGLPLAIVTIGGYLAEQPTKSVMEWLKLIECISVEMVIDPKVGAVKTVLMKSYDGLPYYLSLVSCICPSSLKAARLAKGVWCTDGLQKVTRRIHP
jgi:hypothetical protein